MDKPIRRRQPRLPGGRPNRVLVKLSDPELATLTARAEAEGLTVAHYLVRTALGAPPISARAIMLEFTGIRRLVATATSNLNQVARHANSGSYDVAAHDGAVGQIETAVKRLNDSISKYGIGEKNRP